MYLNRQIKIAVLTVASAPSCVIKNKPSDQSTSMLCSGSAEGDGVCVMSCVGLWLQDVVTRWLHQGCVCVLQGQLYLLVTDQGFLTEEKVVWESLHNVDGDGNFCDSEFRLRPSDPESVYHGQQDQIDQVRTTF